MRMSFSIRMVAAFLVFVLSMSCCSVFAEDIYTESDLSGFKENIRFLSAFDLIENNSRDAATTVKRGDFADIITKYLGYGYMAYDGKLFSDVPDKESSVYTMVQLGLINGYPDGGFRPDDNMLYEEAVKVLITALGYHCKAETEGGYPYGYLMCATTNKLISNTDGSYGKILTYFDLVQMLVNAMSIDLMEQSISSNEVSYSVVPGSNWLNGRFNVEKHRGIVTGTNAVDLNERSNTSEKTITVDNVVYKTNEDYQHLIGCYVEIYSDRDNVIWYITELKNTKYVFSSEEIQGYKDKTYETYNFDTEKTRNYTLAPDAYIMFNGRAAGSLTLDDMIPEYGTVTLINNDDDGLFDVVSIESYDIYIVKSVDADDKRIFYENSSGNILEFAGVESLIVADTSGKEIPFEEIPVSSVLRVGFSKDNSAAKIIVSEKTVKGTVTKITNDGQDSRVFIDGVSYKTALKLYPIENYKIGMSGTFYLDSEGLIVNFEDSADKYSYGYLVGAGIESGFNQPLKLRIFDLSEQILVLTAAKKVSIDGLKGKSAEETYNILKKGTDSVLKQAIRFRQNSAGEVIEIDTPYNNAPAQSDNYLEVIPENGESPEGFRLIYSGTLGYYARLNTFGGRINISKSTPIINVFGDDERDWQVATVANLADTRGYNIQAYSCSSDERFANFIFIGEDLTAGVGGVMGVVAGIETVLDIDDNAQNQVVIHTQTAGTLTLYAEQLVAKPYKNTNSNTTYSVDVGDIVECVYTGDTAKSFNMIYKRSTGELPAGNTNAPGVRPGAAKERYAFGTVYSQEKGYINITNVDLAGGVVPTQEQLESHYWSAFRLFKVEEIRGETKVTTSVTASDILDYKTAGSDASDAFVVTNWEYPRFIVIYE